MTACETAAFHNKIQNFTAGYEERVGEKGTKLSSGELQRLAIARLLLRDSKIVLFDEAMSSLDSETEWTIQERLREWCVDKTVIIIAHWLATVAHADFNPRRQRWYYSGIWAARGVVGQKRVLL